MAPFWYAGGMTETLSHEELGAEFSSLIPLRADCSVEQFGGWSE